MSDADRPQPDDADSADRDDFATWIRPALVAGRRLASRLAGQDDADDVTQDALTRAWQKRQSYDAARGTPATWFLAIVADTARTHRRTRTRRLKVVDDRAPLPDTPTEAIQVDVDLEAAITRLTDRQQLAVHLHYFVGMTVEETAQVMACAPGTVKSTLFDARTRLRALLGDDDD